MILFSQSYVNLPVYCFQCEGAIGGLYFVRILVKSEIPSTVYLFLTNSKAVIKRTTVIETALSEFHCVIARAIKGSCDKAMSK